MYSRIAKERGYGWWLVGKKQAAETIEKRRANNHARRERYGYYHTPAGLERLRENGRALAARRPRTAAPDVVRSCRWCGQPFACRPSSPKQFCSRSCAARPRNGPAAGNWRGGESLARQTERHITMSRAEYRDWRTAVFVRDDYTCQACGVRGGRLRAHHIKPWRTHPELRLEVSNGQTLCAPCHLAVH